jgi:dihydroxyacetone kinase phosphoprotein-dependent L subunit
LRAALDAGLTCIVTPSSYTLGEDFSSASAVLSTLGETTQAATVFADPHRVKFPGLVDINTLTQLLAARSEGGSASLRDAVRTIADTAIENETYFCELDAAFGDGDFGYSLARGFETVLEQWDSLDPDSSSAFLRGVATTLMKRLGGTSGPIWGTAFLRAGTAVSSDHDLGVDDVVAMLDAALAGIMKRGGASVGDKTLLDALSPLRDEVAAWSGREASGAEVARAAAKAARAGAEHTKMLRANRGRASYVGERSIGAADPGAVAVAVMAERVADLWA